jgi:hypothetical protein
MHWPMVFAACPFKAGVHALQPLQTSLQHTPSAMMPDTHSEGWLAVWPLGFWATQSLLVASQ